MFQFDIVVMLTSVWNFEDSCVHKQLKYEIFSCQQFGVKFSHDHFLENPSVSTASWDKESTSQPLKIFRV